MQAERLTELASKHALLQQVEQPTHAVETLDLVYTNNCELVNSIMVEDWTAFSDHRLVIVLTYFKLRRDDSAKEEQFLCETGRRYKALNFHLAPWTELKTELDSIDWGHMQELAKTCPTSALAEYHKQTLEVLEKLVPLKKKKFGKSKPKMHRLHSFFGRSMLGL